jgi:hypothetical protein
MKSASGTESERSQSDSPLVKIGRHGKIRRHAQGITLVMILAAMFAAVVFLTLQTAPKRPQTTGSVEDGVLLQFGLSRAPITRSLRLDLCPTENPGPYPECRQEPDETVARPDVSSVALEADLVTDTGEQFPVGQFTISAANVGRTGLLVTVGANPASPEDVAPGTYVGEVLIDRVGDQAPIPLRVRAVLEDRSAPEIVFRVLVALTLGAYAGTLLKWLDESFSPLAALRRRQRRVEQYLRAYLPVLPEGVRLRLEQVETIVRRFDPDGVGNTTLDDVISNQDALVAFASQSTALEEQIAHQRRLQPIADAVPEVRSAIELEQERLGELRSAAWPWDAADEVKPRLERYKLQSRQLTLAMRRLSLQHSEQDVERLRATAYEILADGLTDNESVGRDAANAPPHAPSSPATRPGIDVVIERSTEAPQGERPSTVPRRTVGLWLLDNAWWLTLAVTAAVVVFIGYQSQFLTNQDFEGDPVDYFALTLWALAVQVAGGTILETMGRLRTSRTAA